MLSASFELIEHISLDGLNQHAHRLLRSLQTTGVVVLRVIEPHHIKLLEEAVAQAKWFLQESEPSSKTLCTLLFNEIPFEAQSQGLAGYNRPSPAKEVFRIRRGATQPWPTCKTALDTSCCSDHARFRLAQEQARSFFEAIVDQCLSIISTFTFEKAREYVTDKDMDMRSLSPYDLFLYSNDIDAEPWPNCHEHVDPGLLTCVPCAGVPGLEVFLDGVQWVAIEHPRFELEPFVDIVVFAGATLQRISDGVFPAVLHRVGKHVVPRLSLVYERRAATHLLRES